MFKQMRLQTQLTGAFMAMGSIIILVGGIGWNSTTRLSYRINTLGNNSVPTMRSLWKINEGKTQIQAAEYALVNPAFSPEMKEAELLRIRQAWQQIQAGFDEFNTTPLAPKEIILYQTFQKDLEVWKQTHERFLELYRLAQADGRLSTSEINQLSQFLVDQEQELFEIATESLLTLLAFNGEVAKTAQTQADQDIAHVNFWIRLAVIGGPTVAIALSLYFSKTIAKPLGKKIAEIVDAIASSSSEIAASVTQQERITAQQASSVNQTTATMDELSRSSRQSADQAELATVGAQQALKLTENGTQAVQRTLEGMDTLKHKVDAIAMQINHLGEQTKQIGSITDLVGDLANQTNMLALNAAVEAVRAGEQGKGFAVVASEIRKLADQSKKSAEKINALIADIQTSIQTTVKVTDEGTTTVENGVKIAQETANSFSGVMEAVNEIFLNSQQISLSSQQRAIAIDQVVDTMAKLNLAAQETASGIRQITVSIQQLTEAAQNLQTVV